GEGGKEERRLSAKRRHEEAFFDQAPSSACTHSPSFAASRFICAKTFSTFGRSFGESVSFVSTIRSTSACRAWFSCSSTLSRSVFFFASNFGAEGSTAR